MTAWRQSRHRLCSYAATVALCVVVAVEGQRLGLVLVAERPNDLIGAELTDTGCEVDDGVAVTKLDVGVADRRLVAVNL